MKQIFAILFFFTFSSACNKNDNGIMPDKIYTYLALGDSYTIGESVPGDDNFPNKVTKMMSTQETLFEPARIIAKTGWTTDELETGIAAATTSNPLRSSYDFVSLLIGVNNQYRGRSADSYKPQFEELLRKAIHYAGGRADRVIVLSIPDWGVTPFANGRDRVQIATEIDAYNGVNKQVSGQYNVHYIDITAWTREAAHDPTLLAGDGLHPSAKEYKRWAEKIVAFFKSKI